ncbi:MAG: ribokinase [Clostridiales bacterium]|jgi:ribokinase|nr:ribokinase [Clostridiales bacterium]
MLYVLGSINMDIVAVVPYMPTAGETLTALGHYVNPGGKGANQAVAIGKLGGSVKMIGKVGCDPYGAQMTDALKSAGVDTSAVSISSSGSGIAMILVEKGDNRIVLYPGANHDICVADIDAGLKDAKRGDILIMQLEIPPDLVVYAAKKGRDKGMRVLLNPAPAQPLPDELYPCLDIIAPNETETRILTGILPDSASRRQQAADWFLKKGVKDVIITLGGEGAVVTERSRLVHIPAREVVAVDTTSAGDTFVGACAVKLYEGLSLTEAGRFASVASSVTITRPGAAASIPTLKEVEEVIKQSC